MVVTKLAVVVIDGYHCYQLHTILSNILRSRLTPNVDEIVGDHQCVFRHNRSTTDQIFCVRQIRGKKCEYNVTIYQLFTDYEKAYGSVRREV
jgi:hypothetical protein